MGAAKQLMWEREGREAIARKIAIESRALAVCEVCDIATDQMDPDALQLAYRIANRKITEGDPLVDVFDGNRRALTDLIKEVVESTGEECACVGRDD